MTHIPMMLAVIAAYALFLLVSPVTGCGCSSRPGARCRKCKGTGRRFRLGAPLVCGCAARALRYVRAYRLARYISARLEIEP